MDADVSIIDAKKQRLFPMTDSEPKITVLVTANFSDELLEQLAAVSPRLEILHGRDGITDEIWHQVEVLYSAYGTFPVRETAPNLRWIQLNSAGAEHALREEIAQSKDIEITTASGIHAVEMAEYCLMMMLSFAYQLKKLMDCQTRAEWPDDPWQKFAPQSLRGSTLGIIGYGNVGRELARMAVAVGMRVLASKRNVMQPAQLGKYSMVGLGDPEGELPERLYPGEAVVEMVRECDYVVLTAPHNALNDAIVGAEVFAAMKSTAVFINIGRGAVVAEVDLLSALQEGSIAGAALDVFTEEPLPPDSPFWKLANVIISPHIAGNSARYRERAASLFAENLRRYVNKLPLLNRVSREWQY